MYKYKYNYLKENTLWLLYSIGGLIIFGLILFYRSVTLDNHELMWYVKQHLYESKKVESIIWDNISIQKWVRWQVWFMGGYRAGIFRMEVLWDNWEFDIVATVFMGTKEKIKYLSINGEEILSRSPQVYARHIKPPAFYEDPTRYFFNLIIFISIFILPIALYYSYHGYRNRKKIDKIFASRLEQKELAELWRDPIIKEEIEHVYKKIVCENCWKELRLKPWIKIKAFHGNCPWCWEKVYF